MDKKLLIVGAMAATMAELFPDALRFGTVATPTRNRPTREEEEREARARCDRRDALNAAEEKRKRKNSKRLADAKKICAGGTAIKMPNVELTGAKPVGGASG